MRHCAVTYPVANQNNLTIHISLEELKSLQLDGNAQRINVSIVILFAVSHKAKAEGLQHESDLY